MDQSRLSFLQNVLSYTTAQTDTSSQSNVRELPKEDKDFLINALEAKRVNPIEEMKKCIKCLEDENDTIDRHLEALETLRDWCEDINFAIDFHKVDGYNLLPKLLNSSNDELRTLACDFVATLAQNNEYCQHTLINSNILQTLLDKLDNDQCEHVKVKSLYGISCLTRDYNEGQEKFLSVKGVDVIIRAIQLSIEKLQLKSCFLVSSICKNIKIKAEFTKQHLIEILVNMYRQTELNIHEHVLSAIISLIDDNPDAINQAKHMNLDFKNILMQRLAMIENDPSCREEKENAMFIIESLFKN